MKRSRYFILSLAVLMQSTMSLPVYASEGTNVTLKVVKESETDPDNPTDPDVPPVTPETFSVIIPAAIPISMTLEGKITIPEDLKIVNENDSAIKCTNIDVALDSAWTPIDFDTDVSGLAVDTKNFSMALRGDKLDDTGAMAVTEASWNFAAQSSLPLNTRARISKQSAEYETSLAKINWTFDWSTNDTSSDPDIGKDITNGNTDNKEKCTVNFVVPDNATLKGDKTLEVTVGTSVTLPKVELYGMREELSGWKDEVNTPISSQSVVISKDTTLTAVVDARAENPKNWFIADGTKLTGLSSEYLNMIDAPTDLVIPNNIGGSSITSIGANAFKDKNLIKSIVIPSTVTSIDATAFTGCGSDLKIDVSYADRFTIAGAPWSASVDNIIWSSNIESWDTNPVSTSILNSQGMRFVAASNKVEAISSSTKFSGVIQIPTSVDGVKVTQIGSFSSNTYVKEVIVPATIETISDNAFKSCVNLSDITLPNSLTTIKNLAFYDTKIQSIKVPNTVDFIGDYAFSTVEEVVYNGIASGSPWGAMYHSIDNNGPAWDTDKITESEALSRGITSLTKANFTVDITLKSDTVTDIKVPTSIDGLKVQRVYVKDNSVIETIEYPDSPVITSVDSISNCANLREVKLPKGIKTLVPKTIADCPLLSTVILPEQLVSIGGKKSADSPVFYNCPKIENLNLNIPSLETISFGAFKNMNLKIVTIPSSVTKINEFAFDKNVELTSVNILATDTIFDGYVFGGCTKLESVILPTNLKTISRSMFAGCKSLKSINIPNSVTVIYDDAFRGTGLVNVTLPDNLASILSNTFSDCTDLETVTLKDKVSHIRTSAFANCTKLNITIPNTVTLIETFAFKNVPVVKYSGTATGSPWGALSVIPNN